VNNVYAQIGLVMLLGLAAKNAILIVEFAKERYEKRGMTLFDATVEGAKLRFRPILMTSFAFILGVVPLVIASGAGAAARHSLGTAVFGGMIFATSLGVFFIPLLYVVMQSIAEFPGGKRKKEKKASEKEEKQTHSTETPEQSEKKKEAKPEQPVKESTKPGKPVEEITKPEYPVTEKETKQEKTLPAQPVKEKSKPTKPVKESKSKSAKTGELPDEPAKREKPKKPKKPKNKGAAE